MIVHIRSLGICSLVVTALALTTAGCGGNSSNPVFSRADLPDIVAPKPPLPKGTRWIDVTTSDGDNRALGFEGFLDPGPLLDELRKTDFQLGYHMIWSADARAPYEYRNEAAYAFLFRTDSGARTALAAFRQYTPRLFPKALLLDANELRDDSYGIDASGRHVPSAFYIWRIGNILLFANAYCEVQCPFAAVTHVARVYADTLDANANRKA